MSRIEFFSYTDEQWNDIRAVVRKVLGVDADQIMICDDDGSVLKPLRDCIEIKADIHTYCSVISRQRLGHKTRIKQLTTLRSRVKAFVTDAFARSALADDNLLDAHRALTKLVRYIDREVATEHPRASVNSSKAPRNAFWNELLAIWLNIGGKATGTASADFLIVASRPVFQKMKAVGGRKSAVAMPQYRNSVVEWLRLRAKSRQRASMRRKVS